VSTAAPIQTVQLDDGLTLGYRELGSGPPVLLVHGWPTSSFLWRRVMPSIADRNQVLALDLPGFGASDKPADGSYDWADFERAIDGFLDALGIDRVAIAGHDLGGPVTVHWLLANQERATHLALLNTLLYPEFHPSVPEFIKMLSEPASRDRLTSDEGLGAVIRLGLADDSSATEEMLAGLTAPFASADDRLALARAGIGLDPDGFVDIAKGLPSLELPVRVVYGEKDRILPDIAETVGRVKRDVPQAEVTALPGCGHFLQEEEPERIGELLAPFFASHPA
jgi:pimeloyl-ACP methyl ester carboxylesterase